MIRILFALSLSLSLLGCGPSIRSATPRSITFARVNNLNAGSAAEQAQEHCNQYGRDAEEVPDGNEDNRVTYRCVDRQGGR